MGIRKQKVDASNLKKSSFKYVLCSDCRTVNVKISEDCDAGTCWLCMQKKIEPPQQLIKKDKDETKEPRKQRGWQFMAVYVDYDGTVYHKGIEQPELKGTLPVTPKKEYKRKTFQEKKVAEEKHQQKLAKLYEKKKAAQEKLNRKQERKLKQKKEDINA